MSMNPSEWIKASASNGNGSCVEMRRNGEVIQLRDTKDKGHGPILNFTPAEIAAFIDGASKNEFNGLL